MIISQVRNVCEALPATLLLMQREGREEQSRAGPVLVLPSPLITVTQQPMERVLHSAVRDANPFFHMIESLWMLVGWDDEATLNFYVRDFGKRFAERQLGDPLPEKDGRIHDAYGRRWRTGLGFDQLDAVVRRLTEDPTDRQCVIQMWDASQNNDLLGSWKTRPCNTHVYLRLRGSVLDLTVCCRSNDMIWGGHGANAVHFSVLQEYLAARIDVGIGTLYQLSNNAHVYVSEIERLRQRAGLTGRDLIDALIDNPYNGKGDVTPHPMFSESTEIDADLTRFMIWHNSTPDADIPDYANDWFSSTATRAVLAHRLHKGRDSTGALDVAQSIAAPDWRAASIEWLARRAL